MKTKTDAPGRGWYHRPGINGVASLQERIDGLEWLARRCEGKTVLDLGCAEGLISQWLVDRGALFAAGIDYNKSRIEAGKTIVSDQVDLTVMDLAQIQDQWRPSLKFDIVLLLAILQKMSQPEKLLDFAISHCTEYLAVRTPAPVIDDRRSDHRKLYLKEYICSRGFEWTLQRLKPVYVGIFRRL